MTEYTAKTMTWFDDGKIKWVVYHVHEQTEPVKIKMGPNQKNMHDRETEAPMEKPCA